MEINTAAATKRQSKHFYIRIWNDCNSILEPACARSAVTDGGWFFQTVFNAYAVSELSSIHNIS